MGGNQYVFISYSTKDDEYVNQIVETLKYNNINYWLASECIPIGSSYAREIPKAIAECAVFLLVVSKSSQESIWVEKELDTAVSGHKNVVPVFIDDSTLNSTYRFYLNNVQSIKYNLQKEYMWRDMIACIRKFISGDRNMDDDTLNNAYQYNVSEDYDECDTVTAYVDSNNGRPYLNIICTKGMLMGMSWSTRNTDSCVIGRGVDSDIRFPADSHSISRAHCKFFYFQGQWTVVDLNSKNGTNVNGRPLLQGAEFIINSNVVVSLAHGEVVFTVEVIH